MKYGKIGRTGSLFLSILLLMTSGTSAHVAFASTKAEIDSKIKQTEEELKNGKEKESQLTEEISSVNREIMQIQDEITELDSAIEEKQQEVEQAEEKLRIKGEEIGIQNESLDVRLRTMYKSGDSGMLEVLLGSSDISELLSNLSMIQKIYVNDAQLLKKMEKQYGQLEEERRTVSELREQLLAQQSEKQSGEQSLSEKMEELQQLEKQVKQDNTALEAQLDELNKESEKLTEELQQLLAGDLSSYEGGTMLWPVPNYKRISSRYGYRIHPILHYKKMHTGVDISASSGESILAASDGKVIYAAVRGGYGKCVMIDHGGGIVTLYGHCSSLLVSNGQSVTRGQKIALVGSTGLSTGPHCHFEVRVNGSTTDPLSYLDLNGINVPAGSSSSSVSSASSETAAASSGQTESTVSNDGSASTEAGISENTSEGTAAAESSETGSADSPVPAESSETDSNGENAETTDAMETGEADGSSE